MTRIIKTMKQIRIINGPNLNLQGKRLPDIYGDRTFDDLLRSLRTTMPETEFSIFQSNSEGEIIDAIQQAGNTKDCIGIILNAGAYSHYSIAIADAVEASPCRVAEVHISNIYAREEFRHHSVISRVADVVIAGAGLDGYTMAAMLLNGISR